MNNGKDRDNVTYLQTPDLDKTKKNTKEFMESIQEKADKQIKTICINCIHILDARHFLGSSVFDILEGKNFLCTASPLEFYDSSVKSKNCVTGKYSRLIDKRDDVFEKQYFPEGADEYAYHPCGRINNGQCEKYKEKIEENG